MDLHEFRTAGHALVDRLADHLEAIERGPLFPDVTPDAVERLFDEPLPAEGEPLPALLAELEDKLYPYCVQTNHPGYMGLITPSPLPVGILADLVASALNQNLGTWTIGPSAVAMERRTVRWLTDLIGWDGAAGGNLTSGGMMANFIALKLARDRVSGDVAQHRGLSEPWAVYTSEERHVSVDKAVDAVGFGRDQMRVLPTDDGFALRLDALEEAIARDRREDVRPACIVAMAGSTNTGAVDDLAALRRIADRERMWLHADAAYGGGLLLSERHRGLLDGLALADSVTIDPHKWFYAPLDAGAVLVRDATQLTRSFGIQPAYLAVEPDAGGERYAYYVHGFEQSRRFRSLKVWMSFKRYGTRAIGAWVDANVAQALHLWERATAHPDFEAARRPAMSAVCIRYRGGDLDEARREALHTEVVRRIERGGRFWFATTHLKGRTWFRINPVNFRTRTDHMDALFDLLVEECRRAAG